MAKTSFGKLLEPGQIGSIRTKNRILKMGATLPGVMRESGYIQQRYIDLYEAFAKGGAGLVTIAAEIGRGEWPEGFLLDDDKYIPKLRELTQAVHKYHCPIFLQLAHVGTWVANPIASTALSREEYPMSLALPRAVTVSEIKGIVNEFASQTERAQKAGFDGLELNAGCNHFLNTFLSPAWNKRVDDYGGSTENRARIIVEIIQEIKRRCGNDFAVVCLFNAEEPGLAGGITLPESQALSKLFEAAGADAIHPRVEFYTTRKSDRWQTDLGYKKYDSTHFPDVAFYPTPPTHATKDIVDTSHHGAGGWVPAAAAIKKAVKIPVIAVGRLDPEMGEKLLRNGMADFINLNRRLMADHDLPNKLMEGRLEDIAPCTACMTCFAQWGLVPEWISCRINAALGKEKAYEIKPAATRKNVMVIGGGPGGMEAARVAALRGHHVILYEKDMLGGSANAGAVVKGTEREDILSLIDYLKRQTVKAGVEVRNKEATKTTVQDIKPDVVIVAAGGTHSIPDVPGINSKNVLTSAALQDQLKKFLKFTGARLMTKLLAKYVPVGKHVVIIGGGIHGCQTAEFLVKRGKKVTIVESGPKIGEGLLPHLVKPQLLDWLDKNEVDMIPNVKYEEINSEGLIISVDGRRRTIKADTILTATPLLPNTQLMESLKGSAAEVYAIGDCREPNLIANAINEGSRIARSI
jgi:2,4-dienoyl-CoA reductase (NADPH2)